MLRIRMLLSLSVAGLLISGCSELRVIGMATVRELSSDAINVEQASYRPPEQAIEVQKTQLAKATPPAGQEKKKERKKGLWENL